MSKPPFYNLQRKLSMLIIRISLIRIEINCLFYILSNKEENKLPILHNYPSIIQLYRISSRSSFIYTPPQVGAYISCMPNLPTKRSKAGLKRPLVNISAVCSLEGTNGVQIVPLSSFSLMKCRSTSMCFVRSC